MLWQGFKKYLTGICLTIPWAKPRPDKSVLVLSWQIRKGSCWRCCRTSIRQFVCVLMKYTNIFSALLSQHVSSSHHASVYIHICCMSFLTFVFLNVSMWFFSLNIQMVCAMWICCQGGWKHIWQTVNLKGWMVYHVNTCSSLVLSQSYKVMVTLSVLLQ